MRNFKPLAIFNDCTARFVSEDRFSHNEAHLSKPLELISDMHLGNVTQSDIYSIIYMYVVNLWALLLYYNDLAVNSKIFMH